MMNDNKNEDRIRRQARESFTFGKSSRTARSPINNREVGAAGLSTPQFPEKRVFLEAAVSKSEPQRKVAVTKSSNLLDNLGDQIRYFAEMKMERGGPSIRLRETRYVLSKACTNGTQSK